MQIPNGPDLRSVLSIYVTQGGSFLETPKKSWAVCGKNLDDISRHFNPFLFNIENNLPLWKLSEMMWFDSYNGFQKMGYFILCVPWEPPLFVT